MNEYNVILKLFNKFEDFSFCKNDIPESISSGDIANLLEKELLEEELRLPSHCLYPTCEQEADAMLDGDKVIVRCTKYTDHTMTVPKSHYVVYRMKISSCLTVLLSKLLGDISVVSKSDEGDRCEVKVEKEDREFTIIFSMESIITSEKLFKILSPHLSKGDYIILIHKSTPTNYTNIESILQKLPLGNIIFNIPLEEIENKKIKKELEEWIDYIGKLSGLETKILDKVDDDNFRELIISVDTNPKYILSAFYRLKMRKVRGSYDTKSWEEMEHLVTLIFHYMYISDIKYGGGKQRGKSVPDNIFFVRDKDGKIKLAGIVDCKYSMDADLSKEKTEKYENYFKKVRSLPWNVDKRALIFVVLDIKSEYAVKEFFRRLEKKLEKGEYILILPLKSLEWIIQSYLSVVLHGKINLNKSDFNDLLIKIFDRDFLEKTGKIETNLYQLNPEVVLEELKKRTESSSSIETAFEEAFE